MEEIFHKIPRDTDFEFLGGDLNIKYGKKSKASDKLEEFLQNRQMSEAVQEQHTFYRMHGAEVTSSHIDRWFSNITPIQELLVEASATAVTKVPYTVASYCNGQLDQLRLIPSRNSDFATHVTDHIPVALSLQKVMGNGNATKSKTIPDWTLNHPKFGDHFDSFWKSGMEHETEQKREDFAFKRLANLQKALFQTSNHIDKTYGKDNRKNNLSSWELALHTYKKMLQPNSTQADIKAAAKGDTSVLSLIDTHHSSAIANGRRLREHLDNYITQQKGGSSYSRTPSRVEN
jgi:hypothetical protein